MSRLVLGSPSCTMYRFIRKFADYRVTARHHLPLNFTKKQEYMHLNMHLVFVEGRGDFRISRDGDAPQIRIAAFFVQDALCFVVLHGKIYAAKKGGLV